MKAKIFIMLAVIIGMSLIIKSNSENIFGTWTHTNGRWSHNEEIEGNNLTIGDSFYLSEKYVDGKTSFVLQCDFEMKGRAVGLVFGAKDRQKPGDSWYCINVDTTGNVARAFFVKGGLKWNLSKNVENITKTQHTFKVIFIAGGEMSFYIDDIHIGSYTTDSFEGGYIGVMTCYAESTFSNIRYSEFAPKEIKSLDFKNIEFNKNNLAYVDYETKELILKAEFDDSFNVTIQDKKLVSGQKETVKLNIGCNQIPLISSYTIDGTKIEETKYLIVHRAQSDELLYREQYRPQLHYSSAYEWINDPNGMTYNAATKEYHLFYQTRPRTSATEPNQCWYHAVSKDMIHWEQIEPALLPDELGFCWSGSGGIDKYNTSGLFDENTDPEGRMVLIYSSVYGDTYYGVEKISLAYSNDNGYTWSKYDGNPIIKNGENYVQEYTDGFRDPKLIWYEDSSYENGGTWLMLVGGGQGRLFQSDNLLDWTFQSALVDINGEPLHGECPDMFRIEVENEKGTYKWVYVSGKLDLNQTPMVFQTTANVGRIEKNKDGKFIFVSEQAGSQVLYGGYTLYATQSFSSLKDGRVIQMSWAREGLQVNGNGVSDSEVKDWNGLMSWPMELKLYNRDNDYVFTSYPVKETEKLRSKKVVSKKNITINNHSVNLFEDIRGEFYEINATLTVNEAEEVGFKLRKGNENEIDVKLSDFNQQNNTIKVTIDATKSGKYGGENNSIVVKVKDNKITIRIIVDTNLIEVYLNEGEASLFALAYPEPDNTDIELYVIDGKTEINNIDMYTLKSIWGEIKKSSIHPFMMVFVCLLICGTVLIKNIWRLL